MSMTTSFDSSSFDRGFHEYGDPFCQKTTVEDQFFVPKNRRGPLSCTSIYLDPELAEFLEKKIKKRELGYYLKKLTLRYQSLLPRILPQHGKVKKLLQPRIGCRKRFSFRPYGEDFWKLKLMAMVADVSIGVLVALMLWLEKNGFWEKTYKHVRGNEVMASIKEQTIQRFTLIYNPFTMLIKKKFKYQKGFFYV